MPGSEGRRFFILFIRLLSALIFWLAKGSRLLFTARIRDDTLWLDWMASPFALACITCDVFYELHSKDYIPHHFLTALSFLPRWAFLFSLEGNGLRLSAAHRLVTLPNTNLASCDDLGFWTTCCATM